MFFFLHVGHSSGQLTEGLQEKGGSYYTFRKIKKEIMIKYIIGWTLFCSLFDAKCKKKKGII